MRKAKEQVRRKLYWNDLSKLMRILHRIARNKVKLNCSGFLLVLWCSVRAVWQHCTLTWYSLKPQLVLHLGCSFSTPLKIVILLGKMESKAAFIACLEGLDGVIRSTLFIKLSCKLGRSYLSASYFVS